MGTIKENHAYSGIVGVQDQLGSMKPGNCDIVAVEIR